MPSSMTGFARQEFLFKDVRMAMEIKSVNHRYRELSVHFPMHSFELEQFFRGAIEKAVGRGKIHFSLRGDLSSVTGEVEINEKQVEEYYRTARNLSEKFELESGLNISHLLGLPNVLVESESEGWFASFKLEVEGALDSLLSQFNSFRAKEGVFLAKELLRYLGEMESLKSELEVHRQHFKQEFRQKLQDKIAEHLEGHLDEVRLNMEAAYLIERSDIEEEMVRLQSHIESARQLLNSEKECGKKLNFIAQELNREINTIGSKSSATEIVNLVIEFKSLLEKFREQIQNLE